MSAVLLDRTDPPSGEGILTGSWVFDVDRDRSRWSPEMFEIYGVSRDHFEPTRAAILALTHPDDRGRVNHQSRDPGADNRQFAYSNRLIRPDGEVRVVSVRGWVDVDERGEAVRLVGTTRDITARQTAARNRERLGRQRGMALEATRDGICGLDGDGAITFANWSLRQLLGREDQRLEGSSLHELAHRDPDGREAHAAAQCPYHRRDARHVMATDAEFRGAAGDLTAVRYVMVADVDDPAGGRVVCLQRAVAPAAAGPLLEHAEEQLRAMVAERDQLLRNLAAVEESERLRLAADIHDDTAQTLRAVVLELELAREQLTDADAARALLRRAGEQVGAAATRLRQLMFELMPPVPEADLRTAIDTYCALLFTDSGIHYAVRGEPGGVPTATSLVAYRLTQEALRNVLKHAHARVVLVELESGRGTLRIAVSDDGVGWQGEHDSSPAHAGLEIARRRAQAAGGFVRPGSGLNGAGASIEFTLPIDLCAIG